MLLYEQHFAPYGIYLNILSMCIFSWVSVCTWCFFAPHDVMLSKPLTIKQCVERVYMLTFCALTNIWSQLLEHLCLLWTLTAAGRSAPTLGLTCSTVLSPRGSPLPTSRDLSCQDTPSPVLLLPKVRSTVSSKGQLKLSFYNVEQNQDSSKTPSIPSACSLSGQTPAPSPPTGLTAAEVGQPPNSENVCRAQIFCFKS